MNEAVAKKRVQVVYPKIFLRHPNLNITINSCLGDISVASCDHNVTKYHIDITVATTWRGIYSNRRIVPNS